MVTQFKAILDEDIHVTNPPNISKVFAKYYTQVFTSQELIEEHQ